MMPGGILVALILTRSPCLEHWVATDTILSPHILIFLSIPFTHLYTTRWNIVLFLEVFLSTLKQGFCYNACFEAPYSCSAAGRAHRSGPELRVRIRVHRQLRRSKLDNDACVLATPCSLFSTSLPPHLIPRPTPLRAPLIPAFRTLTHTP